MRNYTICQTSCSQTQLNQFNVLYPPSRKARTQNSYGGSTQKNRVQPQLNWLIRFLLAVAFRGCISVQTFRPKEAESCFRVYSCGSLESLVRVSVS